MPPIGSTTTPSTRRSSPQTFSTSSASWMPSTQMRLAAGDPGPAPPTAMEPEAVTRRWVRGRPGATSVHGSPLDAERAPLVDELVPAAVAVEQRHPAGPPLHHRPGDARGR